MTLAGICLRPFDLRDAAAVASWLDGPGLGVPSGPVASRWAQHLVADPRLRAWIAHRDGIRLGFVRLDIGPDRIAELTLAVATGHRRVGIGRVVLQLVLEEAHRLRVRRVQAVVDPGNAAALQFFADAGFDEVVGIAQARMFVRWIHEADREALEIEG